MHTFDRDGDGQLNRTEIAGAHAALAKLRQKSSSFDKLQLEQFVQHYDVNGNHRLDPEETRQVLADWKLPGVAFPPLTGYGDLESAMGINHGLLRRFDRNRDGRLDEAEKDAARRMIRPPQRDNRVEGPARRPN